MDARIVAKAKEFASKEVAQAYMVACLIKEWQEETGGTLDDYISWMEMHCEKRGNNNEH